MAISLGLCPFSNAAKKVDKESYNEDCLNVGCKNILVSCKYLRLLCTSNPAMFARKEYNFHNYFSLMLELCSCLGPVNESNSPDLRSHT